MMKCQSKIRSSRRVSAKNLKPSQETQRSLKLRTKILRKFRINNQSNRNQFQREAKLPQKKSKK